MAVTAVIFDFWGTLVEAGTWSPLRQTYQLLNVRMPFGEFVQQFEDAFMTKPYDDQASAFRAACEALNIEAPQDIVDKLIGVWNKTRLLAKPYPETLKALDMLKEKGVKLGLISNTDCFGAEELLERFELAKRFDAVALSFKSGLLKTDPKMFELVLGQLGAKPSEALMVGDSVESDMAGAENAGVRGILIDRKGMRIYPEKIRSLLELERLVG
jgi:putative hydrolase of the HAD superfamily